MDRLTNSYTVPKNPATHVDSVLGTSQIHQGDFLALRLLHSRCRCSTADPLSLSAGKLGWNTI